MGFSLIGHIFSYCYQSAVRPRVDLNRAIIQVPSLIVVLCLSFSQSVFAAEPFSELFGYPGQLQGDISDFPNWQAVVGQVAPRPDIVSCQKSAGDCQDSEWREFLEDLRGENAVKQLKAVNRFVNGLSYIEDIDNYGQQDYWANPTDFLNNGGDCEDFAILKMASLMELGWSSSALRIVVVQDTAMKQSHAVLAVALGADVWVLDNQRAGPAQDISIENYAPVYALSCESWWLYAPANNSLAAVSSTSR
jgi:predicted transglutaminase-like cysteine proteinase